MPSERFINLPQDKKKRIIDAALKEFARVPFQEISINRIIQDAEIKLDPAQLPAHIVLRILEIHGWRPLRLRCLSLNLIQFPFRLHLDFLSRRLLPRRSSNPQRTGWHALSVSASPLCLCPPHRAERCQFRSPASSSWLSASVSAGRSAQSRRFR